MQPYVHFQPDSFKCSVFIYENLKRVIRHPVLVEV